MAEAKKGGRNLDGPMTGEQVDKLVADLYDNPPDIVKEAAAAVK